MYSMYMYDGEEEEDVEYMRESPADAASPTPAVREEAPTAAGDCDISPESDARK